MMYYLIALYFLPTITYVACNGRRRMDFFALNTVLPVMVPVGGWLWMWGILWDENSG